MCLYFITVPFFQSTQQKNIKRTRYLKNWCATLETLKNKGRQPNVVRTNSSRGNVAGPIGWSRRLRSSLGRPFFPLSAEDAVGGPHASGGVCARRPQKKSFQIPKEQTNFSSVFIFLYFFLSELKIRIIIKWARVPLQKGCMARELTKERTFGFAKFLIFYFFPPSAQIDVRWDWAEAKRPSYAGDLVFLVSLEPKSRPIPTSAWFSF